MEEQKSHFEKDFFRRYNPSASYHEKLTLFLDEIKIDKKLQEVFKIGKPSEIIDVFLERYFTLRDIKDFYQDRELMEQAASLKRIPWNAPDINIPGPLGNPPH